MKLKKIIHTYLNDLYLINEDTKKLNNNFKNWFGNSKIKNGSKPLICYHGTSDNNFNTFKARSFRYNGIYLTTKYNYAKSFGSNVLSLYVSLKNPYIINMKETNFSVRGGFVIDDKLFPTYREMTKDEISFLTSRGYDGIVVNVPKNIIKTIYGKEEIYNGFEIVVFNPNNVKSIENDGSWDNNDDNIFS